MNSIININILYNKLKKQGYIDCSENENEYESIMAYLDFCRVWFLGQQINEEIIERDEE